MKIYLFLHRFILVSLVLAAFARAEDSPPTLLRKHVEDSVGGLSFVNQLQINLELGNYYDVLKQPDQADKFYDRINEALESSSPKDTAENARYLNLLLIQLEKLQRPTNPDGTVRKGAPNLPELVSRCRAHIIRNALDESDDRAVQNGDLRAMGSESAATLAQQLSLAPEFRDLFRMAIDSFTVKSNNSVSRTQRLASLVSAQYRDDAGSSPDDDKSRPCWDNQRVLFDEGTIKTFTCTSAAVAAGEPDLTSKENYGLIQTLLCEKPFAETIASCSVRFNVQDRKIAIEMKAIKDVKDRVKGKCEIPESLKELADDLDSPQTLGKNLPQLAESDSSNLKEERCQDVDDTLFFSALPEETHLHCDDYILQLKMEKGKDAQEKIFEQLEKCKELHGKDGCFERVDKAANGLDDPYRIPMLASVARDSFASVDFAQTKKLEQRLMASLADFNLKYDPGSRDLLLNQIDDSLSQYLSKAWENPSVDAKIQGFMDAAQMAQSIPDGGVRARLSIHVLERFSELGDPTNHFSNGMMGLPTTQDLEDSEKD